MRIPLRRSNDPTDLVGLIHHVRRRWRYKLLLRGVVGVLGIGLTALLLSAWGLEAWRFSPGAIITFRIVLAVALVVLVGWFLVRPLLRRASDEQVALYLEEHEPSLQAEIISAIEASRASEAGGSPHSAALVRRLVESAVEKCQAIDGGRHVERVPVRRYALATGAIAVAALLLFTMGPGYLRHALSALFVVSRGVEAAAPYRIHVSPGHATVPRGGDQVITARLDGFEADQPVLMIRKSAEAVFERVPLIRSENPDAAHAYEGMLFDLAGPVEYFVEAAGVKSPTYTLKVVDLPYVQRLELEFHYPAYTGLEPRKVEDGGDIAVVKGTEVRVRIVPTMASPGGQILLHDSEQAVLSVGEDGALTTSFKAERSGFYRVELDAPTGERVSASPQYTIDILSDRAPTVSISKPGRDTSASPIEEVFIEARAEDDFGVKDLDLIYSVNGGPEKTVRLFDGKNRLAEVTAGHTLYLEELDVEPGDFVSYYARAADNDAAQGAKRATSDLYFLQVRPLGKEFRRAQSMAGGGGGGGGDQQVGALSQQQRQIIAATFNINRDRRTMTADKLRESAVVIALAQARLREQVDGLLTRMNSRLVEQDPAFARIAELLPQAVTAMEQAEAKLRSRDTQGALEPEQKALQILQRAEEEYEVQVSMQRGGGGGGGGGSAMAQDLADIFELELDRMANQYETAQRAQQQQADQRLDELMEKLKELARRQEQEAERLRRAAAGQQQTGGGGAQQRSLAEQVEDAARRLEQLSREENRPELMASARQLREAADAMRQASADGQAGAAQASSALERLQEAQRRLQQSQSGRAERDVKDAIRQADEIAREQQQIAEGVRGMDGAGVSRRDRVQQLSERKDDLESRVAELEKQLDRAAADLSRTERETSRRLGEAAGTIRDNRLRDKIRYSRSMIRAGVQASDAAAFEGEIGNNIGELQKKLGEAAAALGQSADADAMTGALERAQELARGIESLDQRMRERATEQGRDGRQNPQGQPGEQGQQGQQGQKGQQGQQGQKGQQGQQGQQGEPGQQGQGGEGGRNDGARTAEGGGGEGDTFGRDWQFGGGVGDRRPGRFTPEDVRQFRGELRQWTREAEQLRKMLQGQRLDPKELDQILRNLRALDDDRVYQDVTELARLQSQVAEGVKRFEYGLRRRIQGDANQILLSGSDEVPEQFRKLVEQYYRSLSKAPEPKAPEER